MICPYIRYCCTYVRRETVADYARLVGQRRREWRAHTPGSNGAVWCRWWSRGVVAGKRPSPRRRLQAGRWSELGPPGRPFSNPASRWRLSKSETWTKPHPCRQRHVSSTQFVHSTLSLWHWRTLPGLTGRTDALISDRSTHVRAASSPVWFGRSIRIHFRSMRWFAPSRPWISDRSKYHCR
jgi:hypothetical protein